MTIEQFLLLGILITVLMLVLVVLKRTEIEKAISSTWVRLGLAETIGAIRTHADEIKQSHKTLEQMLRVPTERASLGEISLELILADHLPQGMFGIREKCLNGKVPDAYIRSQVGLICIDAKFPLDNYAHMVKASERESKQSFGKRFLKDVRSHLDKIARDYVCPENDSADFAFAYIPSEAVYYFLVSHAYDTLREFTKRGVQVASPLTLSHKVELIKLGVLAMRLNENAREVRDHLKRLGKRFDEISEKWNVLYSTHLRNMKTKAEELDAAYTRLKQQFDGISQDFTIEETT